MTTSNSVDFSLSRDDIINEALMMIGEGSEGEAVTTARRTQCAFWLNVMCKAWMAQGAKLWAMKLGTLFLSPGTASYSLGATGTHCTNNYVSTTLSTAAASGATSINLTATTGMVNGGNIGIVLDDGTIHWTTINGAPAAPTLIVTGLASAAASGNVVFSYATKVNRPQRIDQDGAYWHSIAGQDTPVSIVSRTDYARLSSKTASGKVVQAFYDPQLVNGTLSVWPTPDDATDVLKFWYERVIEDFDTSTDTPDFAIEWSEALITGLASRIAPSAGAHLAIRAEMKARADEAFFAAMGYDRENVSLFFQPDIR